MLYLEIEESKKGRSINIPERDFFHKTHAIETTTKRILHEQKSGVYPADCRFVPAVIELSDRITVDTHLNEGLNRYSADAKYIRDCVTEDRFDDALDRTTSLLERLSKDFNFDGSPKIKGYADPSIH